MEKQIIMNNGRYGARIGGIQIFTMEGAIRVYQLFAARCYSNLTMEASVALSNVAEDMHRLGFTWDEIEALEISAIQ